MGIPLLLAANRVGGHGTLRDLGIFGGFAVIGLMLQRERLENEDADDVGDELRRFMRV